MKTRARDTKDRAPGAVLEREDVQVAATRCPYCHEDVARAAADVCQSCLARHHGECWVEGQRCGSCGAADVLRPARPALDAGLARKVLRDGLRERGYGDEEIERALPPPADRCPAAGCVERGVSRGDPSHEVYCLDHARRARRKQRLLGGAFMGAGLLLLALGRSFPAVADYSTSFACGVLLLLGLRTWKDVGRLPALMASSGAPSA